MPYRQSLSVEFEEKEMGMEETMGQTKRQRKGKRERDAEKLSPQREWQKRREKEVGRTWLLKGPLHMHID